MKHFLKLGDLGVAPVLAELAAAPDLWGAVPWRKTWEGTPHSRMSDIWFRYADPARYITIEDPREKLRAMANDDAHVWYRPQIDRVPSVRRIVDHLVDKVGGESVGLVIITRIPPGEGLDWHWDRGRHCEYHDKLYVTLQSEPGALFCDGGPNTNPAPITTESLNPKPGECWLYDNTRWHSVVNYSAVDRVTLIVCIHTGKFDEFHGRPRIAA